MYSQCIRNASARSLRLAILCSSIAAFVPCAAFAEAARADSALPGELLIKFKPQAQARQKGQLRVDRNMRVKTQYRALGIEHWAVDNTESIDEVLDELRGNPLVEFVEPNYRRYPRAVPAESGTYTTAQQARFDQIKLTQLWDVIKNPKDKNVVVAIIDDAFDTDHEDLNANMLEGRNFSDSANPTSDVSPSASCFDPEDPSPQPIAETHGTKVAGVVGAVTNNGVGIAGSSWNAYILPIKIGCLYSVAAELAAFNYLLNDLAQTNSRPYVINASYGGPNFSEAERTGIQALANKNILFVAAAGNAHRDNDIVIDYPSGLDLPNILSVAATDANNAMTAWSQYGQTRVDVAAPGQDIITTNYPAANDPFCPSTGIYTTCSGTSFSAPLVAGVAALLKAAFPSMAMGDVKAAIMASADAIDDTGRTATDGQINAMAAYTKLQNKSSGSTEPLLVVSQIEVNDSEFGNGNGRIDRNETAKLVVTLKNEWDTALQLSVTRTADFLSDETYTVAGTLPGGDSYPYEINIPPLADYAAYSEAQITLTMAWENGGFAQRRIRVPLSQLSLNETVENTLHKSGNNQDDFHYYHVDVPSGKRRLTISLESVSGSNLDILVKKGGYPQFDYDAYEGPGGVDDETVPGAEVGDEKLIINDPDAGTYYIVVLSDPGNNQTDIAYRIRASTSSEITRPKGCSSGQGGAFDPTLWILLVVAVAFLARSRTLQKQRLLSQY